MAGSRVSSVWEGRNIFLNPGMPSSATEALTKHSVQATIIAPLDDLISKVMKMETLRKTPEYAQAAKMLSEMKTAVRETLHPSLSHSDAADIGSKENSGPSF